MKITRLFAATSIALFAGAGCVRGSDGPPGPRGAQGAQGAPGPAGSPGPTGPSGFNLSLRDQTGKTIPMYPDPLGIPGLVLVDNAGIMWDVKIDHASTSDGLYLGPVIQNAGMGFVGATCSGTAYVVGSGYSPGVIGGPLLPSTFVWANVATHYFGNSQPYILAANATFTTVNIGSYDFGDGSGCHVGGGTLLTPQATFMSAANYPSPGSFSGPFTVVAGQ